MKVWCYWRDFPKELQLETAKEVSKLVELFCESSDRYGMRQREEAFIEKLYDYAFYTFHDSPKKAKLCMEELNEMMSKNAKKKTKFGRIIQA